MNLLRLYVDKGQFYIFDIYFIFLPWRLPTKNKIVEKSGKIFSF